MSILTLAYPVQAATSLAQGFSGALRAIVGVGVVGIMAVVTVVFKPLAAALQKVARSAVHPRMSKQQRKLLSEWEGSQLLNELAKEVDATQPSLAAEMRYLAARG